MPQRGQAEPARQFSTHAWGGSVAFSPQQLSLLLPERSPARPAELPADAPMPALPSPAFYRVQLHFEGTSGGATLLGHDEQPGKVHYLLGADPAAWQRQLPTYATLLYDELYPGIDLAYSGSAGNLKSTYTVAPGANPAQIQWRYTGTARPHLEAASGSLQLALPAQGAARAGGVLIESAPVAWQEVAAQRVPVAVAYRLTPDGAVGFTLGAYDASLPLVIDPVLLYSTYLGESTSDQSWAITHDTAGNLYLTGLTGNGTTFPTTTQPLGSTGGWDVIVVKFSPTGEMLYSTYLGGSANDAGRAIAVDSAGRAVVVGQTLSTNFPTQNPHRASYQGGANCNDALIGCHDAFVVQLTAEGDALVYGSYLGGAAGDDIAMATAVDITGTLYVAGYTLGGMTTVNAYDSSHGGARDGFLAKINPSQSLTATLTYNSYLGESGHDLVRALALGEAGSVYVAGDTTSSSFPTVNPQQGTRAGASDAFLTQFAASGQSLPYSSFLGGSLSDVAQGLAFRAPDEVYLTGFTLSGNFPITQAAQSTLGGASDAFVSAFDRTTRQFRYSSYLGGTLGEQGQALAVDAEGSVSLTGHTISTDFPTTNAFQATRGGASICTSTTTSCADAMVARLTASGSLLYSSYLGGSAADLGYGLALAGGHTYLVGLTGSEDFPVTGGAFDATCCVGGADVFLVKVGEPLNLRVVHRTSTSISLAWDAATDLTAPVSYELYQAGLTQPLTSTLNLLHTVHNLTPGTSYTFTVRARDSQQLSLASNEALTATLNALAVPTLPTAPDIDQTVPLDLAEAVSFLYEEGGVQKDMTATIDPARVAVLRGYVLDHAGAPLSGTLISVLGHPEYGYTVSRADGLFDLVVNGGGIVTLNYEKAGYFPAQRQVDAPWQDYAWLDEVVLLGRDSAVTTVGVTNTIQVAQGITVTDSDGTRRATLLFPAGVTATVHLADGTTQPLSTLHVRATEYTVGARGPQAMPGELPPTSGYTYAVELSVDEAQDAGASQITFSKPITVYVQHFLTFTVGSKVPVGYYDREKAAWVASDNGLVIKIVEITSGLAGIDTDNNGLADNAGFTPSERTTLAQLYPVGTTLWSIPISHFSPWDFNWAYGPIPLTAQTPRLKPQERDKDIAPQDCECREGSLILSENQTLAERIEVGGSDFDLHYGSDRADGRTGAFTLDIPLVGPSVPDGVQAVELEVLVAGQRFTDAFTPTANLSTTFTWNGQDGYGREVQGQVPVKVEVGYRYKGMYYSATSGLARSFGQLSANPTSVPGRSATTMSLSQATQHFLGIMDARGQELGGAELTIHHIYDPNAQTLYLGNGSRRDLTDATAMIIAGTGNAGASGDGTPATQAQVGNPVALALGADGTLYIASQNEQRVRQVNPDGTITTTASFTASVRGLALGPDGSLYISTSGGGASGNHVYRRWPEGSMAIIAGVGPSSNGSGVFQAGDGGQATQAYLVAHELAVAADGSVYVAGSAKVRRIGPDGLITTVAGTGMLACPTGAEPWQANSSHIGGVLNIALGPDGSLYIAATNCNFGRVWRVRPDGKMTKVAGGGTESSDGLLATQALVATPLGLAVGPDGSVYIAHYSNLDGSASRVRRVTPDGFLRTVAGPGNENEANAPGPISAYQAYVHGNGGMPLTLSPDGTLYVGSLDQHRVRAITPAGLPTSQGEYLIPSEDGREVYHFDSQGRHQRTLDARTNATIYDFDYDAAGRLTHITDQAGQVTTITRPTTDTLTITAPGGQSTDITLDANGYLASVTTPAEETTSFEHSADGLLEGMVDAGNGEHAFAYSADGHLSQDTNAIDASTALTRTRGTDVYTVTLTNGLADTSQFRVQEGATGVQTRTLSAPNGGVTTITTAPDGTEVTIGPDGVKSTLTYAPDPRWGMAGRYVASRTRQTASGTRFYTETRTLTATLSTPADPLSMTSWREVVTINGRTTSTQYDAATLTQTVTDPAGLVTATTFDA